VNIDVSHPYRLAGRSLALARLGWTAVALIVLVPTLIASPAYYNLLRQVCDTCLITPALVDSMAQMGMDIRVWSAWQLASTFVILVVSREDDHDISRWGLDRGGFDYLCPALHRPARHIDFSPS
jgi:hypothetical protein